MVLKVVAGRAVGPGLGVTDGAPVVSEAVGVDGMGVGPWRRASGVDPPDPGVGLCTASTRAVAKSAQDGKRSAGALPMARRIASAAGSPRLGLRLAGEGAGSCTCWYSRDGVSPLKGGWPTSM